MNLLPVCIESCLKQTMPINDYEIIIVDDCSTDGTYDMVQSYVTDFPNLIKGIQLEENSGGCARPRNVGMGMATGEYLFFLDADDTIDERTLEKGYLTGKENDSDVVIVSKRNVLNDGSQIKNRTDISLEKSNREGSIFPHIPLDEVQDILGHVGHFVRRSSVEKLQLRFNEEIYRIEDTFFLNELLLRTENAKISGILDKPYYFYNQNTPLSAHLAAPPESEEFFKKNAEINVRLWCDLLFGKSKYNIQNSVYVQSLFKRCLVNRMLKIARKQPEHFSFLSDILIKKIPQEADKYIPTSEAILISALRLNDYEAFVSFDKFSEDFKALKKKVRALRKEIKLLKEKK